MEFETTRPGKKPHREQGEPETAGNDTEVRKGPGPDTDSGRASPLIQNKEGETMKYNLRKIMLKAWELFRKLEISFAEALHRAWLSAKAAPVNAERIRAAKELAGILEEVKTWSGWKEAGFEVIHGSKALFGCELIYGSKGDGATYKARFFGASQVQAVA
jgi:hypothetical protein